MTSGDRGVSEVLGFVLAFALITSTVGLVYASGFSGLYNAQEHEQLQNMERAFDVMDDNFEDLNGRGPPSRATELKLPGGSIRMGDTVKFRVKTNSTEPVACNATGGTVLWSRPVVYQLDDEEIVYSGGAVIRSSGDRSTMLDGPDWIANEDQMLLSLLTTAEGDGSGIAGETTILVVGQRTSRSLRCEFPNPSSPLRVNVTVESPRTNAWAEYFEEEGYEVTDTSDTHVTAKFNTSRFFAASSSVDVKFER